MASDSDPHTIDLLAAQLADTLNETLDVDEIGYLDVLDALAAAGVTLTADTGHGASPAYLEAVELEGLWVKP